MALVHIDWHPDAQALRTFGVTVLVGMAIFGALFWFVFESHTVAYVLWGAGAVLGLPALTGNATLARPGYVVWMSIAFVMGNIMSRLILALLYYLLFTPIGLLRRLLGHDPLRLKKPATASYWVDLENTDEAERYERQF